MTLDYNTQYEAYLTEIEQALAGCISPGGGTGGAQMREAMRYSLENGGKRIRPVLTLAFCALCGGQARQALPFALALEMIHTYSLIHDDLPCMDDDDMRRGKPANHIRFGEAAAVLAGDALLTQAFATAAQANLPAQTIVRAVSILADAAGYRGMIAGQAMDLANEGRQATQDVLEQTDALKTGALIRAAAVLGCTAANADENLTAAAEEYAGKIGLAFQIVDDILDESGDAAALGKPTGSDRGRQKSTYVTLLGLAQAKQYAQELTKQALQALADFPGDASFLCALAQKLMERNH